MLPVEVAYALPEKQLILRIDVPEGTTIDEAIRLSEIAARFPELDVAAADVGIFGKVVKDRGTVLKAGDRVEIYRPLLIDPKAARAERARKKAQDDG
jgi:putative ubiquitin-RnfH superfamily antitoxin RatB of RatAB toxin-antitoxin module